MNFAKLTALRNVVTSKAGRQILTVRRHSPAILFGVGVVGVVTTVVLACKATLKIDEVLDEHEESKIKMDFALENIESYDEDRYRRDRLVLLAKTSGRIARLYLPGLSVGVLSIWALTGSHIILTRRNIATTAAYAALDKGFRDYRDRVRNELGLEKDAEFRYGYEEREFVEESKEGPVVKAVRTFKPGGESVYARIFDPSSEAWERNPMSNRLFLNAQQTYLNDRLHARGYMFLNEVYRALGLEESQAGQVIGWVIKDGNQNHISFGIFERAMDDERAAAFINGREGSVLLDFNVDGPILNDILKEV